MKNETIANINIYLEEENVPYNNKICNRECKTRSFYANRRQCFVYKKAFAYDSYNAKLKPQDEK